MMKPFSQACENNKNPILKEIKHTFSKDEKIFNVLEIGSGTGQHAVYFAEHLPHIHWYTSDLKENHSGISAWIDSSPISNISHPLELDVTKIYWPDEYLKDIDAVFSANTTHIMPWKAVVDMFKGFHQLPQLKTIVFYGPFKYNGEYTSDSNRQFNFWLKDRARHQGIRDFEAVNELAEASGFHLQKDVSMPANNQLLVWQKMPK
ncbi:DUF938 domain-containing protein [Teredinibacter sp. KSP-S5-2]|uniref:DUF938 domain-containing protein n=1 Tax=Teredinibacter sp. KSP-S5-2 TaxID=3034506 RepID=UPI00293525E4|nr:DUF938 domain-containing protein [Teredinibacter sp. KSP-S5-2]WNO10262.1 DUF938 domain-containing protein [Teredinibacter sp. KSP-S5-2]